ncbi:MAG: 5'-nucleotidase C-terminal domain-containing protein [Alphaproteobacteria bacterium]|uniref:bifunctional metallophosphatase/5'-nucleotidase n=1 Tax=Devosia sp. XGJD_8 TaxID=3391187 RepID=UPI001D3D9739|nr:5'-nucleotidase C-terminal domain-containing protein [Alphaproteobacteria bacterium]MBU1560572.1 5'-nucleotidase C-terminal domain-containing protein [Alphaproteobacteria bacterium]MBU2301398.1 5'-nucleotidase C-terminal domain-containing protein [Alphaproteobacteria bacterium]MBU2367351.1 5'-nucleotidase C-terminal domain-containing protein [Alphaproteobacteria bacterium]
MKRLLLGATALTLCAGFSSAAHADFTLNILHINDFHSRFDPITGTDSNCNAEDDAAGECFGGIARLKTIIDDTRAKYEDGNSLLLSAGDNFQGSLYYTTYKSKVVSDFFNQMGFDVVATGNHEFDDGPEEFMKFIEAAEFPIIGGNFDVTRDENLRGKIKGSFVIEIGGEKIGIIGATTEDTPEIASPGPNVEFTDVIQYVRGASEALDAAGVNKIILLSHIGYTVDMDVAAALPLVDVIVGGHSHTLLSNTAEGAAGPYPTMVTNPDGVEVPVVQANQYGKYLGDIAITWDDNGVVTKAEGEPYLIDASVVGNEDFAGQLAELAAPIEEAMGVVIGTTTADIDGSRETCRVVECQMGNLVADAMLDRVVDQGVTIAIQNGGGLRASIDAGEITVGEVITVLPFSNTLATVDLSGADVIEALENGVSDIENGAGRFPQVAGLKYSYTLASPAGERISDVMVGSGDTWAPIDEAATYSIVTNNYMRGGGDGYGTFAEGDNPYDFGPPLEQVLADFIAKQGGEYTPYTDGRITVIE